MPNLNSTEVQRIVKRCFELYEKLPKTGKPIEMEWTVLSCIVKFDRSNEDIEVVSLGTGSKCIGASKLSPIGDIMNDSHAEVFARRGFLIYLYESIERHLYTGASIMEYNNGKFKVKDSIEFVFYSSQLPCGDASIIPKTGEEEENFGDVVQPKKRQADAEHSHNKRLKTEADIHRTGAKCLPHAEQDPREMGNKYHIVGQVRTKPGRGDRTLSVSCSDKMAKWIHLGIHGSLLDILCDPVYIKHFIFGAGVPYSEESLVRALLNRKTVDQQLMLCVEPIFYQSSLVFSKIKTESNSRAAPGSVVWVNTKNQQSEVAVQGKKLGVTKKKANLPSSSLCISKYNLYKRFVNIVHKIPDVKSKICGEENLDGIPYNKMKSKSSRYLENWLVVKEELFKIWTAKPDMWDFCVS